MSRRTESRGKKGERRPSVRGTTKKVHREKTTGEGERKRKEAPVA